MSQHFLVLAENDWSDEFSADSFAILENTTKEQVEEDIKNIIAKGHYFGTNEGWEPDQLDFDDFTIREITPQEVAVLKKFFPRSSFGTGVFG